MPDGLHRLKKPAISHCSVREFYFSSLGNVGHCSLSEQDKGSNGHGEASQVIAFPFGREVESGYSYCCIVLRNASFFNFSAMKRALTLTSLILFLR